ncbi:Methyl-accepting chemotaxis protein [Methylobacterium sp. 174MFSha1.1]|nr:Methyl-accepting chemotaxis protein [Methylobacterium sp. 174MFSha1.1]
MRYLTVRNVLGTVILLFGAIIIVSSAYNLSTAFESKQKAHLTYRYIKLSRAMLESLAWFRSERGWSMTGLGFAPEANQVSRRVTLESRGPADQALSEAAAAVRAVDDPALVAAMEELAQAADSWRTLRGRIDADLDRPLAGRDKALFTQLNEAGGRVLTLIDGLSTRTDTALRRLDPALESTIATKAIIGSLRSLTGQQLLTMNILLSGDRLPLPTDGPVLRARETQVRTTWDLIGTLLSTSRSDLVQSAYRTATAAYFEGSLGTQRAEAVAAVEAGRKPSVAPMDAWLENAARSQSAIAATALALMDAAAATADAEVERARQAFAVHCTLAVAGLLLTLVGAAIAQVWIAGRIHALATATRRIADGDLAVAVPGTRHRDEIGAMAAALEVFRDTMQRSRALERETEQARLAAEEQRRIGMRAVADAFEEAVGAVVAKVSASAAALEGTARSMTATATETAGQSTSAASAAEQAATNVDTVAAAVEELGSSVQEIGRQIVASSDLAGRAVAEADQTMRLVQEMTRNSTRIGDMVGMIATIASQTNLLALNATIEAARAGEAGRGFAVVAAEVKALATQTAKATDEIGQQIGQIQVVTDQAVGAITAITTRIGEISTVTATISAAVEEQGATTQEIVRNVAQASAGTQEVTGNVAGVAMASERTGAAARQVLDSASDLSRESEHLGTEVQRFLARVRAA